MKTVKLQSSTEAVTAADAETNYIIGKNVTIDTVSGAAVELSGDAKYRSLDINGIVHGGLTAVRVAEQEAPFGGVNLHVGEYGQVSGDNYGMVINGQGHVLVNEGEITSGNQGLLTYGTNRIVNTGTIHGDSTGLYMGSGNGEGFSVVINKGTISGGEVAIEARWEYEKVVNSGKIEGNVTLGDGDDSFIFLAGKVDGTVSGEDGDDKYVVHKAGLTISEAFGEGTDSIYSSVTFTMPANVEKLYLTGKADIDATGGTGGNWIYGNAGANHIDAGGGFDFIDGGKGNDVLTGGSSSDDFHFGRGTGRDVVTDFEAGFDEIQLGDLKGAKDFADMTAHHLTEKGDDVWITYGQDVVVLKGMAGTALQAGDFDFG